jgi:hypothetical protein
VAIRRDPTGPTLPTIKRLFAHSGNRCAFPKCTATLIDDETVVGKVCHIKGARPGSARHDPQQRAAERHGFDNLILMCGRHHDVIDADEEAYTVGRLVKMKADHQSRAESMDEDFTERAAQLFISQPVTSVNQSGGITAHTVHLHAEPAQDASAARRAALARIETFHQERAGKLNSTMPQIPVLDGGKLLMHIVPLQTFDEAQPQAFAKLCANPERFPPFVDTRPRDHKINFDGLFTGSNAGGIGKPQRAYVYVFRSGAVEAVASSLARGRNHSMIQLPNIQCMIIHYARIYTTALEASGIRPPFAITVSLIGVKNMRLLQDFIENALLEDLPYGPLDKDVFYFGNAIMKQVPEDDNLSAKMLNPVLSHLANAAHLATSPYFDADGNYTLKVACPAG